MQGSLKSGRRSGTHFVILLVAAHVMAATLFVSLVSLAAPIIVNTLPRKVMLAALVVASLAGVFVDARAVRRRWFSVGLPRQTPKMLLQLGEHSWITPLVWGFDTGLVWTTYRVSFCSWLVVLLALAGVAPPWAGAVYGLAFGIPLFGSVRLSRPHLAQLRLMSAIRAQLIGIGSIGILAGLAVRLMVGHV